MSVIIVKRGIQGSRGLTGLAAPASITVANNIGDVNTVADNIADINAVAANAANINAVEANETNIDTVATNIASVNSAATNMAAIIAAPAEATAAAASAVLAAAAYDSFDDRYLGSKAANPALDNDGNALLEGALYWNNVVKEMRTYDGANWVAAYVPGTSFMQRANNLSDLLDVSDARDNLGLGALALLSSIAAGQLDTDAVTTIKILNDAITTAKLLDGNVTLAKLASTIGNRNGTAVATTSGTSINYTSLPSTALAYLVSVSGVSENSGSPVVLQIGDATGGVKTSGYSGGIAYVQGTNDCGIVAQTLGFGYAVVPSTATSGLYLLVCTDASTNTWTCISALFATNATQFSAGTVSLSGVLDRIRLTTNSGAGVFDAGKMNVLALNQG